jgi:hypothetical protein
MRYGGWTVVELQNEIDRLVGQLDRVESAARDYLDATVLRSGIDDPRSSATRRRLAILVGVPE